MSAPLRVVLINPRDVGAGRIQQKCYPPLGLLYLAAALERGGHAVEVIEANAWQLDDQRIEARVAAARPDLVGVPVLSETTPQVSRMLDTLRRSYRGPVVLGGVAATATPDRVLEQIPAAGFLLRGEAEESILALCRALRDETALRDVPGLSWHGADGLRHNPAAPPPALDAAHRPARHLVQDAYRGERYFALLERSRPTESLLSSRGCPCGCRYCYNHQHSYRTRSPEDVVAEVVAARTRGIRHLELVDDNFTLNRRRAMRILELVHREAPGLRLVIKSRPESVDAELLAAARRAGVYQVSYGFESGVQRILDAMDRRQTVEQNAEACALTKAAGIACHASFLFGIPPETPETIEQTIRFVVRIKPSTVNLNILRPYPRTAIYERARDEGTLMGDWGEPGVLPWVRLPWTRNYQDIARWLDIAKQRIYFRPHYALRLGGMMLRGMNPTMAAYAWQEAVHVLRRRGPVMP